MVITPLSSKFLSILLTFAFEKLVACCICFCQTSPFSFRKLTIFCSLSISVGIIVFFFVGFGVFAFVLCTTNQVVVPAINSAASIAGTHHAGSPPMTCLAIIDIGSSCPFCSQYSIILCPSEYVSFVFGVM